ncbi:hypothetical protein MTO96_022029 [Rhipicephalus appendiculatus]
MILDAACFEGRGGCRHEEPEMERCPLRAACIDDAAPGCGRTRRLSLDLEDGENPAEYTASLSEPSLPLASSREAAAATPGDARPKTTTTALPRFQTAMGSTGESQTAAVRQYEPRLGEEVMDFAAQNRDEAALPGNCNAAPAHADADFSTPAEADRTEEGWQISPSVRAKKKQAKEQKF